MKLLLMFVLAAVLAFGQTTATVSGTATVTGSSTVSGVTATSSIKFVVVSPPTVVTSPVTISCTVLTQAGNPIIFSGAHYPCMATLAAPAPAGGTTVPITQTAVVTGGTLVVTVPPSVTIPAGATSAPFTITAK